MRAVVAVALLLAFAASASPAAAALDPVLCPSVVTLRFADDLLGMAIEYDGPAKTLTFTTADGRQLVGRNARLIGRRRIQIDSRSTLLTVRLQADLRTGMATATAVERDPHPQAPGVQGAARLFHRLFVPTSRAQIGACRGGPARP